MFDRPEPVTFVQGNIIAGRHSFEFGPDHVRYGSPEWTFNVRYASIAAPGAYSRHARKAYEANAFWIYASLVALCLMHQYQGPRVGSEGLVSILKHAGVFFAICLPLAASLIWIFRASYTVVPVHGGAIRVRRDRQHDAILDALQEGRTRALLALAAPSPDNSPEEEAGKLRWLRHEGILDENEFAVRIASLRGVLA